MCCRIFSVRGSRVMVVVRIRVKVMVFMFSKKEIRITSRTTDRSVSQAEYV